MDCSLSRREEKGNQENHGLPTGQRGKGAGDNFSCHKDKEGMIATGLGKEEEKEYKASRAI